jgi:hypothetical protein
MSSPSSPPPPAERVTEIIDKLPSHPSLVTKTGTAILGSGLLATATSQELYVFNEETVIAVGTFTLFGYIAKVRLLACRLSFILFFSVDYTLLPEETQAFLSHMKMSLHADQNMHLRKHSPSACHIKSGPRTTSLASKVCLTARVPNTHMQ